MRHRTYTREMFEITRDDGIKGFARFVWTMQRTGRLHLGTILLGLVVLIVGAVGFNITGSVFALIFMALGAYLVGTSDGRFCVCDIDPCDDPKTLNADLHGADWPKVKEDGTIVTPHDEMYRPITGDGFEIKR